MSIIADKCQWNPTMSFEKPIFPGSQITEYGCLVMRVNNAGTESVKMTAGSESDDFMGVALPSSRPTLTKAVVEQIVVPMSSPYTVQLKFPNLVTGQYSVYNSAGALINASNYTVNLTAGTVTFTASTWSGTICQFNYRFWMSAQQMLEIYGQRYTNDTATAVYNSVTVVMGSAEMYTDLFDASVAYTVGVVCPLYTMAHGLVTSASGGANLTNLYEGRVIAVPSVDWPWLGFRYNS